MWRRLHILEWLWLVSILFVVYDFESASAAAPPVEVVTRPTDELLRGLTGKKASEIAKEIEESLADAGTRTRVITDVPLGGHKLVELIENTNGTVMDCNLLGDKDLIEMVLSALPENMVTSVSQSEIQVYLDMCSGSEPSEESTGLKSIFDFLGDTLNSLLIFPGTKWCGAGDIADNYDDLGTFNLTDACCREHDHAADSIGAFQSEHGLTNPLPYTVTECMYDQELFNCLLNVGSEPSEIVGALYFNVLKTPCFEYQYPMICVKENPIYIPILTDKCEEYALDTSKPKEWQFFPAEDFDKAVKEKEEEGEADTTK